MLKESDLREFTGSQQFFRHWMSSKVVYTEGIAHLAETAGAFWLIDAIVSHQRNVRRRQQEHQLRDFQVWVLFPVDEDNRQCKQHDQHGHRVRLECWSDTPGKPDSPDGPGSVLLASQDIDFSDFFHDDNVSFSQITIWMINGTILLPSEY